MFNILRSLSLSNKPKVERSNSLNTKFSNIFKKSTRERMSEMM